MPYPQAIRGHVARMTAIIIRRQPASVHIFTAAQLLLKSVLKKQDDPSEDAAGLLINFIPVPAEEPAVVLPRDTVFSLLLAPPTAIVVRKMPLPIAFTPERLAVLPDIPP